MTTRILLLALLSCGLLRPLAGQQPPAEPTAAPSALEMEMPVDAEVELSLPGGEDRGAPVSREAETISVDFPDEEVRTIIRNVADLYELNVVVPDTLVGNVSIKLRNVTWREVFEVILQPLGYTWIENRNIIMIKSREELLQEQTKTRVFIINYAQAGELIGSVQPLIDGGAGGRIQVDKRSNALVITERPSRMNEIQEIVERLDRPTDQVMIESKFVEVSNRDTKNLGVNWSSLNGYNVSGGPFQRDYTGENQQSTNGSSNESHTDDIASSGEVHAYTDTVTTAYEVINSAAQGRIDTAIFNADSFSLVLSALKQDNLLEVISNPTVVTVNNTPAKINIGEEYPIPQYAYNDQRGTFEVNGFEYKEIGIILDVTPQINSAGFINLDIKPEISSRAGTVTFGGASGAEIPIITTRKTQSTVSIKSGYTLAIGGLIEKSEGAVDTRVPVLGNIPVLGHLFRSKSDSVQKRNLIIFITARVLNADGATYRDVFPQRTLYEMGIKSRDLPGYTPAPQEEQLFEQIQSARDGLEQVQAEALLKQQLGKLGLDAQKAEEKARKAESKKSTSVKRKQGE